MIIQMQLYNLIIGVIVLLAYFKVVKNEMKLNYWKIIIKYKQNHVFNIF